MVDVFISYSREDAETARRFADALQSTGCSVWWDDALRSGESFDLSIERVLGQAKAVVVLWSTHSVAARSLAEAEISQRGVEGYSIEKARASAERAIEADATVAEGHAALAEAMVRGLLRRNRWTRYSRPRSGSTPIASRPTRWPAQWPSGSGITRRRSCIWNRRSSSTPTRTGRPGWSRKPTMRRTTAGHSGFSSRHSQDWVMRIARANGPVEPSFSIRTTRGLDPIREHPRFVALMARGAQRLVGEAVTR